MTVTIDVGGSVAPGTYDITVTASGPGVSPSSATYALTVNATSMGVISGYITIEGETDHSGIQVIRQATVDGAPAAIWARVSQPEPDRSLASAEPADTDITTTDATGYFEFLDVPQGSYTVYASRGDALVGFQTDILVGDTDPALVELTLTPTGSITGSALLDGETNHSGVVVFVAGTSYAAYTDVAGAYTLDGVPVGTHTLMAARWGFDTVIIDDVTVSAGTTTVAGMMSLTRTPTTAPYVALTFPEQGSVAPVPGSSPYPSEEYYDVYDLGMLIQFSASMDWASVENALAITPEVDTEIEVRSDALYILASTSSGGNPLKLNTAYSITIGAGAQDIFGSPMANPFTLEFTTGGLAIVSTSPEAGETPVLPGYAQLRIVPNAPLAPQYGMSESTVTIFPAVTGTWESAYNFEQFDFELLTPLRSETEYLVVVDGIRDNFGNELAEPFELSFTTDEVRLTGIEPGDGSSDIDPSSDLTLVFTAEMDEASLESDVIVSPVLDLRIGGYSYGGGPRSYSLAPTSGFWPAGALVSVSVPTDVTDYYGVSIVNPQATSFTVARFRGVESYPPDGALGISTTPYNISIRLNNRLDEASVSGALSVVPSFGYDLSFSYSSDGIELYPTSALAPSTVYTVTLSTGLTTDTGVALEAPYSFSFTTQD